jgi:putative tryptophan/tyrosine transport system substrate-binding protein
LAAKETPIDDYERFEQATKNSWLLQNSERFKSAPKETGRRFVVNWQPQGRNPAMSDMKRREFISLLGGAAVAWPLVAWAQQGRLPVVGVLRPNSKDIGEFFAEPFRRYMKAIGWEEGRNIRFLFVWAEARSERTPALVGELIAQNVDLMITFGDPAIRAAQRATQVIPIVGMTDDIVGSGLATSLAWPGGNTTGVSILAPELDVKRLEILHEFVPQARRVAVLADSTTISSSAQLASAARDLSETDTIHVTCLTSDSSRRFSSILTRMGARRLSNVGSRARSVM